MSELPPILKAVVDARRAAGAPDPPPVLLCCTTTSSGAKVCITVGSVAECPGGAFVVECENGESHPDGTATCSDDDEPASGGE